MRDTEPKRPRRWEPWPLGLAAALLATIGICIGFWWIAATYPDVELTGAHARPGLVEAGKAHDGQR